MGAAVLTPARLWHAGIPITAAMLGLLAGLAPKFAVAAAIGLLFGALMLQNLALGLCLFVVIAFLEVIPGLEALPLAKLAGGMLAFSWIATATTRSGPRRELLREQPVAAAAVALLLAWSVVSSLWSELPMEAISASSRWAFNLVLFPVVYAALRRPEHFRWLMAAFVVGALLTALMGIVSPSSIGPAAEGARLGGTETNPNQLGGHLLVAVILAAALGSSRELAPPLRLLAYGAALLAVVFLVMTVSRGAMLGLTAALLLGPFLAGRGRRAAAVAVAAATLLCGVTYAVALAPAGVVERVTSGDNSGSGRTDIWRVGLRMVRAEPVTGVGSGNYANSAVHYLLEPGALLRDEFIVDKPKVAHNIFLHVTAELGLVGLALFLGIIALSIGCMLHAARVFATRRERSMELLSRALVVALLGLLVAGFFSSDLYSKQLWLLVAVGPALMGLARERRSLPA